MPALLSTMLYDNPNPTTITIRADESIRKAAQMMQSARIGSLVVVNNHGKAIGIVTDRDLCIRAVAFDRDPDDCRVSSCMSKDLRTQPMGSHWSEQLYTMRSIGTRRLPLVDEAGVARELAAIDDNFHWVAERLSDLAGTASNHRRHGQLRPMEELLRELEAHLKEQRVAAIAEDDSPDLQQRLVVSQDSLRESIDELRRALNSAQPTKAP